MANLAKLLNVKSDVNDAPGAPDLQRRKPTKVEGGEVAEPIIDFRNVNFNYPGSPATTGINNMYDFLCVRRAENVCLYNVVMLLAAQEFPNSIWNNMWTGRNHWGGENHNWQTAVQILRRCQRFHQHLRLVVAACGHLAMTNVSLCTNHRSHAPLLQAKIFPQSLSIRFAQTLAWSLKTLFYSIIPCCTICCTRLVDKGSKGTSYLETRSKIFHRS